jgi:hypothetical protein
MLLLVFLYLGYLVANILEHIQESVNRDHLFEDEDLGILFINTSDGRRAVFVDDGR